jgi:uncharacterized protein YcgL (UPF0745 family)
MVIIIIVLNAKDWKREMEIDKEKLTEVMYHLQIPPKPVRLVGAETRDTIHQLKVQ